MFCCSVEGSVVTNVSLVWIAVFQAALTVHDIDADSARGTSIFTDDRSSCRFSDEEVSECVYVIIIFTLIINP